MRTPFVGWLVLLLSCASVAAALQLVPEPLLPSESSKSQAPPTYVELPAGARAWDTRLVGDPLLRVDPGHWLPTLMQTGSLAEAEEVAVAELDVSYNLLPLGDADGDGRGDLLLVTWPAGEDAGPEVLTAVAGGSWKALWTVTAEPERGYWFPGGDVNGDGVQELVFEREGDVVDGYTSNGAAGTYVSQDSFALPIIYEVLDGRDGSVMKSIDVELRWDSEYVDHYGPVEYARAEDSLVTVPFIVPLGPLGQAAVDVLAETYRYQAVIAAVEAPPYPFVYPDQVLSVKLDIERLPLDGAAGWSKTFSYDPGLVFVGDINDFTGDGLVDYVLGVDKAYVDLLATGVHAAWDPPRESRVLLVDGAAGSIAWDKTFPRFVGELVLLPAGSVAPGQRGILLFENGFEAADQFQTVGSRMRAVDGKTGAVVGEKRVRDVFAAGIELGDVGADGIGEYVLASSPASGTVATGMTIDWDVLDLSVVKKDFSEVWGVRDVDAMEYIIVLSIYPAFLPDMDGDGVPDFPLLPFEGEDDWGMTVELQSGATGTMLWTLTLEPDLVGLALIEDANGDAGWDVLETRFEIPEPPADPEAAEQFWEGFNLARYNATAALLDGGDLVNIWTANVYDPAKHAGARAGQMDSGAYGSRDVDGDGEPDVLYWLNLEPEGMCDEVVFEEDQPPPPPPPSTGPPPSCDDTGVAARFAAVLKGVDGSIVRAFPKAKSVEPTPEPSMSQNATEEAPGVIDEVAAPSRRGIPALEVGLALVGATVVVLARRTR